MILYHLCPFPVVGGVVSVGYYDKRPYSVPEEQRKRNHKAWDMILVDSNGASTLGAPIVAPESGKLYFHYMQRYTPLGDKSPLTWDVYWPSGTWYIFSNFYYEMYGCITVLVGDSGLTYLFAHQDVDLFFYLLNKQNVSANWIEKSKWYNKRIRGFVTTDNPVDVKSGEKVGFVGNAGYSQVPHVHMQIHENVKEYDNRIDPAELWPVKHISRNGNGPSVGIKVGADRVPH